VPAVFHLATPGALGSRWSHGYNAPGRFPALMQIIDLRQVNSRSLEELFQEESRYWREELYWDYRPSIDLIRRFVDSRSLGGYAAVEDHHLAGYGFYVLEDHKGLIGGLFVSPRHPPQGPITERLLAEMVGALRAIPGVERIEAQLMPFGTELDAPLLSRYFRLYPRQFMLLSLADAHLTNVPLSAGFRLERWSGGALASAARLIHLAYADHVDSQINDQYCSEAGGLRFLRNIVLLPGCGQFLPEASFIVRPVTGDALIAIVLTSTVDDRVGHTTQICVMPGYQGHGIGRHLMEQSILALRRRHYERLSLTVTRVNTHAVALYEQLGFRTVKTFAAGVWQP